MTNAWIGAIVLATMLILMLLRIPVAFAMMLSGVLGFIYIIDLSSALEIIKTVPQEVWGNYHFSAIVLFIFIGELSVESGLAATLFSATRTLLGRTPASLALASLSSCALFSCLSGSSVATASTMTRVALPQMQQHNYPTPLAVGALAAGGTLGIMIPPSIALLLYAMLTEQAVGDLFLAGLLPGILGWVLYSLTVLLLYQFKPSLRPPPSHSSSAYEKIRALLTLFPLLIFFMLMIYGIYFGWFTPTEGASIGAFILILVAIWQKTTFGALKNAAVATLQLSSKLFLMLIGAQIMAYFVSVAQLSTAIIDWISAHQLSNTAVILSILLFYIVLGTCLDAIAMLMISLPVVYPLIVALQIDPIWFGILSVLTVELGLITPPIGMNIFVIKAIDPNISLTTLYHGIAPFVLCDCIRLILLFLFPAITTILI